MLAKAVAAPSIPSPTWSRAAGGAFWPASRAFRMVTMPSCPLLRLSLTALIPWVPAGSLYRWSRSHRQYYNRFSQILCLRRQLDSEGPDGPLRFSEVDDNLKTVQGALSIANLTFVERSWTPHELYTLRKNNRRTSSSKDSTQGNGENE